MSASTILFGPIPDDLSADQRARWQRRQLTAQNSLALQAMTGTVVNAETTALYRRYVRGEITLSEVITHVQRVQENEHFRQYLNRRNLI